MRIALVGFVILVTMSSAVFGQIGPGRLTETVADAPRAPLSGATVVVTSPALLGRETTTTQADGQHLFSALPPGIYIRTFTLSGFKHSTRDRIVISLPATTAVDVPLVLASLQESVTVGASSPVIDVTIREQPVSSSMELIDGDRIRIGAFDLRHRSRAGVDSTETQNR
jgi:hypothetical protein